MAALNALNMMSDLSVVMDVLASTFAEGECIERLSHDHISTILPLASSLTNSKFELHIKTGLKTVLNILSIHGNSLVALKTAKVGRSVDLAREERLKKADACI